MGEPIVQVHDESGESDGCDRGLTALDPSHRFEADKLPRRGILRRRPHFGHAGM
jgi:hypothetical protein